MPAYPGGVPIAGYISPSDTVDTYAVTKEELGQGGLRSVANSTERLAITSARRKEGMIVHQLDTNTYWTLSGGIADENWVRVKLEDFGTAETSTTINRFLVPDGSGGLTWISNLRANLDCSNLNLVNVANPRIGQDFDAVNKGYVDALFSASIFWAEPIRDKRDLDSNPPTTTTGFRYIASVTVGDWVENHLYEYNGSSWDDITSEVITGYAVYNNSENSPSDSSAIVWNGTSWVQLSGVFNDGSFLKLDGTRAMIGPLLLNSTNGLDVDSGTAITVNNNNLTNLLDPVNPQDAVTKNYIDSKIVLDAGSDNQFLGWNGSKWVGKVPTTSDISNFDSAVSANADVSAAIAHVSLVNNPHFTTASQVGAAGATHASNHVVGGSDVINVEDLATESTVSGQVLTSNGAGGVFWQEPGIPTDILNIPTSEVNTNLFLAPKGDGTVEWKAGAGNIVTSVNSQIGDVNLTYSDVGAADVAHTHVQLHDQGTDTALGAMTADLNMNDHSILNVSDNSITFASGGSITKADYENVVNKAHDQLHSSSHGVGGDDVINIENLSTTSGTTGQVLVNNGDNTVSWGDAGGTETYTNLTPTSVAIGGIPAGSTFNAKTMKEMWDLLLYPYQAPSFSSFSITGQSTLLEVGVEVVGDKTFTWSTTNSSNVAPNTISIADSGGTPTVSGLANSGSYSMTVNSMVPSLPTSRTWTITGTPTQGSNFSRTFVINWRWKMYYGESLTTPLTETDIKNLRVSNLASSRSGTYSMAIGGYKYFAWPTSFGTATSFKDAATNLNVPFQAPYIVSVTNDYSKTTDYYVYRSTNVLGGAINIIVS